jgi:hypothetical protein
MMCRATGTRPARRTSSVFGSIGRLRRATQVSVNGEAGAQAGHRLSGHVSCRAVALSAVVMCCSSRSRPWRRSLAVTRSRKPKRWSQLVLKDRCGVATVRRARGRTHFNVLKADVGKCTPGSSRAAGGVVSVGRLLSRGGPSLRNKQESRKTTLNSSFCL